MVAPRNQRVAEQIKKEMAQILRDELKDPRLESGLVTVTGVDLSNDLHYAKVYVSIYGDEKQKSKAMEVLNGATSFARREIAQRLRLRYIPEITFKYDTSIEHGDYINRLLARVKAEEQGHDTG